ncbi:DUF4240 domain-containing protein [Micromonospora sp. NPDC003197]
MGLIVAADFWSMIGSNVIVSRSDVEIAIGKVQRRMCALDLGELVSFQDELDRNLDVLDLKYLASIQVEFAEGLALEQTVDHFLYARCACLLAGQEKVWEVLTNQECFTEFVAPRLQSAEELLYLARTEYQRRTGRPMG